LRSCPLDLERHVAVKEPGREEQIIRVRGEGIVDEQDTGAAAEHRPQFGEVLD
jgi:hypothetical protein